MICTVLGVLPCEGRPQREFGGRAPTRGAPTNCLLFSAKKPASSRQRRMEFAIAHYDLHSSRRYALRRAPTRGAPTNCQSFSDKKPASSRQRRMGFAIAHYDLHSSRRYALRRAPTRGAPTDCLLSALCPEKGAHKGRPYRLSSLGVLPWEGHPQGVPLPIVFSRRFALRRAPTRGAPTDCLLSAFCPAKGAHKGRPYRLSSLGVLPCEGHPQGVPLPIVFSRRFALRRAPTRGAPTRFRQPHEVFSNLMQLPCRRPAYVTY